MSAAFRPGQPTKGTNPLGSQPAAPGKPSQTAPTGTPTPNAAQTKFGGKQAAFLNAKTSGMDFGGTVYGAPKSGAASQPGKVGTNPQPAQTEQEGPTLPSAALGTKLQPKSPLLQGLNTPGAKTTVNSPQSAVQVGQENIKNDGPGSRFQPKSALLQKQAQPGTQNQGAESQSPAKTSPAAPDNSQPGKQTNGFGASFQAKSPLQQNQTPQANKFGGGQGFGTSYQPKSPLLQSQVGQQVTDGKTTNLQQTSGNTFPNAGQAPAQVQGQQQTKPFQKTAAFDQKQAEPSPNPQQVQLQQQKQQQNLSPKPVQDIQTSKPSDQKFGQKSPEQPLIQQQQKQQLLGQAYGQPQNTQPAGVQQKQLQAAVVQEKPVQQIADLGQKPAEQPGVSAKPYQLQTQVLAGKVQQQTPDVSQVQQQASGPSPGVQKPIQVPAVAPKPAPQVVGASDSFVTNSSESASKLPQVLHIKPSDEIKFEGPFNSLTSVELVLTNPTDKAVCYKVKSNSPHYYFVKPAGDLIEPHQQASVYLMLQTPSGERNPRDDDKHKFMIQSIVVQDRQSVSNNGLERLWKSVRQDEIMETKIPCVFVDASYRPCTSISQSYYEESRVGSCEVRAEEDVKKSNKKQKEVKSSSWLPFIILPIIILLIAFSVYKLKFEGK